MNYKKSEFLAWEAETAFTMVKDSKRELQMAKKFMKIKEEYTLEDLMSVVSQQK